MIALLQAPLAAVVWSDIGAVVAWGLGAGVGLTIIFSLAIRGFTLGEAARREGNSASATLHLAVGMLCGVLCVLAVAVALASMLHR